MNNTIKIKNKEYELSLSLKVLKKIANKYGSLDDIDKKIFQNSDIDKAIEELVFLLTNMINNSIERDNISNNTQIALFTEDQMEIYLDALDIQKYKDAILATFQQDNQREIIGEPINDNSKNQIPE